eukprot:scaffold2093_cov219-Skeletonema_menzelii.AAC.3
MREANDTDTNESPPCRPHSKRQKDVELSRGSSIKKKVCHLTTKSYTLHETMTLCSWRLKLQIFAFTPNMLRFQLLDLPMQSKG